MADPKKTPGIAPLWQPDQTAAVDDLVTVRDWLRYAVSRFEAARLVYGHGTSTALDEAAFLILVTLHLPVDQLEPWLKARVTREERFRVLDVIERRIATRKPAAYLVGAAYIQGFRFAVDERVIVPRSFIGELMVRDGLAAVVAERAAVSRALDLCTGSGCLAILMALTYPNAAIDAVDISPDALAVAATNIVDYGLEDRVTLHRSDLFAGLAGRRYDLLISNPPYVTSASVAAFPAEYRAEPQIAHAGGADGLDIVRSILTDAGRMLTPDGTLVVEVGQGRDALEKAYPHLPFFWLDTEDSDGEVFALRATDLQHSPETGARARKSVAGKRRHSGA